MTARRVTETKGQEINPLETWFPKFVKRFSNEEKEENFKQELKVLKSIRPPYLDEKLTDSFMRFCHRVDRYLLQVFRLQKKADILILFVRTPT